MSEEEIILEDEGEESVEGKFKKLREKLKQCQKEKQEHLETSQRFRADYINLKQSVEKAQTEIVKFANEGLVLELIELADSFDMAFVDRAAWETVPEGWRQGVEQIYAKLQTLFKKHGLDEITRTGVLFNPETHQSVGLVETENKKEDNLVTEIIKKGYALHGKVIRPAQVRVRHYQTK